MTTKGREPPIRPSRCESLGVKQNAELQVAGKRVPVSNLSKVFYPAVGFTKASVIDYYIRISPFLLPHLKNRAVTLKRYPNGVEGPFFYEKSCPSHRPPWLQTQDVWSESRDDAIRYCVINDLPTLVWLANLANLELHTFLALAKKPERPTSIVFDLDPGEPASIIECCKVGLWLRDLLEQHGLDSLAKASGSKGLQIYVPLNTPTTFDATKPFANALAQELERLHPEIVVSRMQKNLRRGKVLIDWSQNDDHKTTACVYSLRAKSRPTVSAPVTWKEVERAHRKKDASVLTFEAGAMLDRVAEVGDLFAPLLKLKQRLPRI